MSAPPTPFDLQRRFVRIVDERADGMVAFEFAVGEPGLFVEMILPQAAFADFCTHQGAVPERVAPQPTAPADGLRWTLHAAQTALTHAGPGPQPE